MQATSKKNIWCSGLPHSFWAAKEVLKKKEKKKNALYTFTALRSPVIERAAEQLDKTRALYMRIAKEEEEESFLHSRKAM